MIDRESRDKLAQLLQSHLNGEISMPDVIKEVSRQSEDPAIGDMLHRFEALPIGMTQLPDCGQWAGCSGNCGKCRKIKPRDERARGAFYKRVLERVIAFLRTDQEYRYQEHNDPPFWKSMLIALGITAAILIGIVLSFFLAVFLQDFLKRHGVYANDNLCWFLPMFAIIAAIVMINIVKTKRNGPDESYWPFYSRQDYETTSNEE